jgi:hypothetical protein
MENRSFFFPASIFSFDQSQDVGILDTKMYAPNGKKDGIQILPVSDVAAKDDFFNIKGVTRDDLLLLECRAVSPPHKS